MKNHEEPISYILWDIAKSNSAAIRSLKCGLIISVLVSAVYISNHNKKIDHLQKEVKKLKALQEE